MKVSIGDLQAYLRSYYTGRANEQGLFMKLVEEVGEVAEVLNRRSGRKAAEDEDLQTELGDELADVIHYAAAIAAINGLDLNDSILRKDRTASIKYNHETNLETFIGELAENR